MVKEYELSSLPEKSIYKEEGVVGGTIIRTPILREVGVAPPLEDDDILAFSEDGHRFFIGYDEEGAYKYIV